MLTGILKCCPKFMAVVAIFITNVLSAQDLDPRAYIWVPVKGNFVTSGFGYSHGGVMTDPTLPVENLEASIQTVNVGFGRSFGLFGKTAQVFAALPYSWAQASADVNGQRESITRSGLSDMRLRASILLLGAPATGRADFAKVKRKTILGFSLNVVAPTGQYFPRKTRQPGNAPVVIQTGACAVSTHGHTLGD